MIEFGLTGLGSGEPQPEFVMTAIQQVLEEYFPVRVVPLPQRAILAGAEDPQRGQCSAPVLLKYLLDSFPAAPPKLLAVASKDLFIPMLSFVFGQAQLDGRVGVISLARLRQEYYGLPPNEPLLAARVRTLALHETGHLFGLLHCEEPRCAMRLTTNIQQFDLKQAALCPGCQSILK